MTIIHKNFLKIKNTHKKLFKKKTKINERAKI